MRKTVIILLPALALITLQNCGPSKNVTKPSATATVFYQKDIVPMLKTSCTPCHFPPDGKVEALDNYTAVKKHIDEIIERVKLPQSDIKFMPYKMKKPAFTEAEINTLVKWKEENMAE